MDKSTIILSKRDGERLLALLENPPEPAAALVQAAQDYQDYLKQINSASPPEGDRGRKEGEKDE